MSSIDPAATAIESDWTDELNAPSRKLSALCESLTLHSQDDLFIILINNETIVAVIELVIPEGAETIIGYLSIPMWV